MDNYVGEWADPYGRCLRITKINATTASVSLFAENQPLARPGYESRPSIKMLARYIQWTVRRSWSSSGQRVRDSRCI